MVYNQKCPANDMELNPGAAQESELQSSGDLPPRLGLSAGIPVPGETVEEEVFASAGPRAPGHPNSTATSLTSHSSARATEPVASNRLCAYPPPAPRTRGLKRKLLAHSRDPAGEREEQSLFYMEVKATAGVSVAWETGAGLGPIGKRPRIFQARYSGGESFAGSDLSSSHTKSELEDLDVEAEAHTEEPGEATWCDAAVSPEPGTAPEWLLTMERGLRCLACCRLYPSLQALVHHVKHGLREGFSCRVYYRALGRLHGAGAPHRKRRRGRARSRECSRCGGKIRHPRQALPPSPVRSSRAAGRTQGPAAGVRAASPANSALAWHGPTGLRQSSQVASLCRPDQTGHRQLPQTDP